MICTNSKLSPTLKRSSGMVMLSLKCHQAIPLNPAAFQFSFSHITIFPFLFIPSVAPPCRVQGAKLRTGPLKICKAASRPAGFGENFSIRPAGRLKIFHQNPQGAKRACRFLGAPYVASHPEPRKVELLTG